MNALVITLCVFVGIDIIILLAIYLNKYFDRKNTEKEIREYGRENDEFIYNLVKASFPSATVFKNLCIPVTASSGRYFTETDVILVNRSGITVIEVKGHKGTIDNPYHGPWCQYYGDKTLEFYNPFEQNAGHIKALTEILRKNKIYSVPMQNFVVFSAPDVVLRYPYDDLFTPDTLSGRLSMMKYDKVLSKSECAQIIRLLSPFCKPSRRKMAEHNKHIRSLENNSDEN